MLGLMIKTWILIIKQLCAYVFMQQYTIIVSFYAVIKLPEAMYFGKLSLMVTCWKRANLLALLCVMFLSLSHVVSWARCGN